MKRQQIILIVCGSLMAVVCLGAGWFMFSAMGAKNDAAEARNQAYKELQGIYSSKVFPNDENIARVKQDEKALELWLGTASNLVHKGDLHVEKETPPSFKQKLQSTVRSLSAHPGSVNGKVVANGFNFGFDKYLGESASLPMQEHVDHLTQQLVIIDMICKELYAAKIMALEKVEREAFEEQGTVQKAQEDTGRNNKRRRRDEPAGHAVKAAVASRPSPSSDSFTKQRFSFVFKARPDAFVDALNRLAAMDLFVVVAETEFRKTDDPLTKREGKKKDKEDAAAGTAAAAVDPATVPHAERIVTDPELEPPVSVKLDIDVFSFEGV